jgi:hypothetical protein
MTRYLISFPSGAMDHGAQFGDLAQQLPRLPSLSLPSLCGRSLRRIPEFPEPKEARWRSVS